MISNEQIALNVTIEEMILDYKNELYKLKNKKKLYDYRIKKYTNNIKKFNNYSNNTGNEIIEIRATLYLRTCAEMIKKHERYINEIAEEVKEKENLVSIKFDSNEKFNGNLINGVMQNYKEYVMFSLGEKPIINFSLKNIKKEFLVNILKEFFELLKEI